MVGNGLHMAGPSDFGATKSIRCIVYRWQVDFWCEMAEINHRSLKFYE